MKFQLAKSKLPCNLFLNQLGKCLRFVVQTGLARSESMIIVDGDSKPDKNQKIPFS